MQFLESSYIGLRSAFHCLESDQASPKFVVIPMVHIGDKSFYQEVSRRLRDCHAIIHEGVPGFRSRLLTQAYQITTKRRALSLVQQRKEVRLNDFTARKIHADVSHKVFTASWRTLPWLHQVGLLILAPLYGCWTYLFASRESISKRRSRDSLSNAYSLRKPDAIVAIKDVMVTERDKHIVSQIERYIEDNRSSNEIAAILFGAGHMPAITAHLSERYGYVSKKAEWVSVIALT